MDIDENYAPFPGACAVLTKPIRPHTGVEESSRVATVPGPTYQNADAQKARPAGPPAAQPMHGGPSLSTPAPVSVVLTVSPIKAHEYPEYEVKIQEAPSTEDEPQPKKRGRPKGWRAAMSHAKMRGDAGSGLITRDGRPFRQKHIPNYSLKRRRRTVPRPDSPPPREVYRSLKPTYTHFLCEWSGCKADLHNMDTLRRHVRAVHLKPLHQHRCQWGKCGEKSVAQDIDGATLAKHLEQAHLVPMTWHVGDGPRNSWDWSTKLEANEETVPDFLKDNDGNQVTPSTRDQKVEDLLTYRSNRRKLKELIMRRDENLESQSSDGSEDEDMESGL